MKHSAIFIWAALLILGCAKELKTTENEENNTPAEGMVEYVLRAAGIDMKATIDMDNNGHFDWSAGDKIAALNSTDSKYYVFSAENADGVFKGTAPEGASFTTCYYPAAVVLSAAELTAGVSSAAVSDANAVALPLSYTLEEASAGKTFPMRGTVSDDKVSFAHLGALIRVDIKDVPAEATAITLSSSKKIAGEFTATLSGSDYIIPVGDGASSASVALSLNAKQDVSVYFPLPVGTFDYTISVLQGSATLLSQATTADKTFGRANYAKMEPLTVVPFTMDYKLRGCYNVGSTYVEWGDDSLLDFEEVSGHSGWYKASIGVPDYKVAFKLYKQDGNVYTGSTLADNRKVVGTIMTIDTDGAGSDISIYTNKTGLDVYFNPFQRRLFTLGAGASFVIPTTEAGELVDEYALIGWHANDAWGSDFFLEAVYGFNDWRTVRIGTGDGGDPHFSFKFRRNGGWSEQIGGIYDYQHKANTYCYAKASNNSDLSFYPGTAGEYDIYLNKNLNALFILPAGTAFNVPGRKEQEDLVSQLYIIGGLNGHNWDQNYALSFASDDNHEWYALKDAFKIDGWGAMVFKIYNGGWGKGINIGWPSSLNGAIGDMNTVYPLWLRDGNDDIPNIQLGTDGGHVDIYIKADLSEIFTLSAGSAFAVPTPQPVTPPQAVFIGDSITQFWDHEQRGHPNFFTSNNYMSKGVEGQTSATIKARFNYDVLTNNPQQVHILCGVNDLAGNGGTYVAPADICQNIADMAASAASAGIAVFIGSALPCNYLWWNTSVNPADDIVTLNGLLKNLCTSKGYTYVNYYDAMVNTSTKGLKDEYSLDGCHPNQAGYTAMEGIVKPLLDL